MSDADRFHIPPQVGGVNIGPLVAIIDREMSRLRDQLAVERSATSSAREALAACEERVRALNANVAKWTRKADELCADRDEVAAELERHKADRRDLIAQRDRMVEDMQLELEHARCDAKDAQQMLMDERAKASKPDPRADLDYKKMLSEAQERWRHQAFGYAAQIKNLEKRAQRAEDKLGKAHCERDEALDRLTEERERFKRDVALAANSSPMLVPGSTAAVIEAYRLLCGHEPVYAAFGWADTSIDVLPDGVDGTTEEAARTMLCWLDEHAPGGRL